ncbi:MAG: hypothetical protein IIV58_06455 [Alistipes sp.]|nr:hypothetical protein [Alistipes sp.]
MRLLLGFLLLIPMVAATQPTTTKSGIEESFGNIGQDSLQYRADATDYCAVAANLLGASKRESRQTVVNRDRAGRVVIKPNVRFGYRREMGPLVDASLKISYSGGAATVESGISTKGWYDVRIGGENLFRDANAVLAYEVSTEQTPVYFYGLGFLAPRRNARTKYFRHISEAKLAYMQRAAGDLWLGIGVNYSLVRSRRMSKLGLEYLQEAGNLLSQIRTASIVGVMSCDNHRRGDNVEKGVRFTLMQAMHPNVLTDYTHTLWHSSLRVDTYCPLWRGATWITDIVGELWSYHTPWLLWPSVGIDRRLRIYSYGSYVDRNMIAAHAVVRQHLYGPFGVELWGGAANVFAERVYWSRMLPSYGAGVRVNLGRGLMLGLGYGRGRAVDGVVIYVKEEF